MPITNMWFSVTFITFLQLHFQQIQAGKFLNMDAYSMFIKAHFFISALFLDIKPIIYSNSSEHQRNEKSDYANLFAIG